MLGTPIVYWNDTPVVIKRRVARSVLYYLAIQGNVVGRTEIMTVFWPDEEAHKARRYLRDILSKLRYSLPDPALLWTDIDNVYLDFKHIYIDIQDYNRIIAFLVKEIWRVPENQPLPPELYAECVSAARLWRSPRILAGANLHNTLEFEEWLSDIEKRRARSRILLLERMARHCALLTDHPGKLTWLYELAIMDPYNEDYHSGIIRILINLGSHRLALLYAKRIKNKFLYELNVQPSAQFAELLTSLTGLDLFEEE